MKSDCECYHQSTLYLNVAERKEGKDDHQQGTADYSQSFAYRWRKSKPNNF